MRILIVLTYYRPHTSGLTIYTERLANALAKRGHDVTVFTTQFDKKLPLEEVIDGVRVIRSPVLLRISKGVISPSFGFQATKLVKNTDVIHLHLPQFDAAGVALRGRMFGKPSVITYHCDLQMPSGLFNTFVNQVVHVMNHLAGWFTNKIITYTQDYADHSPYLKHYRNKTGIIQPPVILPEAEPGPVSKFAADNDLKERGPVIGMAARFATEKGVEVLLDALPAILGEFPKAIVLFAGQYQNVLGEDIYAARLFPRIEEYIKEGHWKWLGVLDQKEMAAFYPNLDIITVPSLNSTESFGLVQIEAMMNGVPVAASNLPGVRQPVKITGMGEVFEIGDSGMLAEKICTILENKQKYIRDPKWIIEHFSPDTVASVYEKLFENLITANSK
jgi:glycosyltransferase involved in cell wall biosynthesis